MIIGNTKYIRTECHSFSYPKIKREYDLYAKIKKDKDSYSIIKKEQPLNSNAKVEYDYKPKIRNEYSYNLNIKEENLISSKIKIEDNFISNIKKEKFKSSVIRNDHIFGSLIKKEQQKHNSNIKEEYISRLNVKKELNIKEKDFFNPSIKEEYIYESNVKKECFFNFIKEENFFKSNIIKEYIPSLNIKKDKFFSISNNRDKCFFNSKIKKAYAFNPRIKKVFISIFQEQNILFLESGTNFKKELHLLLSESYNSFQNHLIKSNIKPFQTVFNDQFLSFDALPFFNTNYYLILSLLFDCKFYDESLFIYLIVLFIFYKNNANDIIVRNLISFDSRKIKSLNYCFRDNNYNSVSITNLFNSFIKDYHYYLHFDQYKITKKEIFLKLYCNYYRFSIIDNLLYKSILRRIIFNRMKKTYKKYSNPFSMFLYDITPTLLNKYFNYDEKKKAYMLLKDAIEQWRNSEIWIKRYYFSLFKVVHSNYK